MDPLLITLTKAGLSAIVGDDSPSLGPVVITQLGLTDATFTVASTLEILPGEFKRIDVSGEQVGDDTLHLNALDASGDIYTYRGFALYLADGTLFAIYGQPGPIAGKADTSTSWLVLDIKLAEGQADNITFGDTNFSNPPATTSRQGIVELSTNAEASEGTDARRALTPAAMQAAILAMLLRVHGPDSGINADLLDGQHGAWYADIVSRLGYVPFDSAGFTAAAIRAVLGYTPLDAADFNMAAVEALMDDPARFGSNEHGFWEKRPNGVIEQWGTLTAGESSSPPAQTFAIPFTDLESINLSVSARTPNTGATNGNSVGGNVVSLTQFNVFSDDLDRGVFWRAIGR